MLYFEHSEDKLAHELGGDHAQREQKSEQKLVAGERCGPQKRAAEIDECELDRGHERDYRDKRAVFAERGADIESVGAAVEAVKDRGEYKQREKRGQQIDVVGAVSEFVDDARRGQK